MQKKQFQFINEKFDYKPNNFENQIEQKNIVRKITAILQIMLMK
jgi:hypothetical protein